MSDISKTCGNCNKYADLHSSCEKVRDKSVSADTVACEKFKKERENQ